MTQLCQINLHKLTDVTKRVHMIQKCIEKILFKYLKRLLHISKSPYMPLKRLVCNLQVIKKLIKEEFMKHYTAFITFYQEIIIII